MKRIFTTFALLAIAAGASAQEFDTQGASTKPFPAPKRHYINLALAPQQLKFDAYGDIPAMALKSGNSFAIEFGSTFFFNGKRPTADMIRFGLDFSYLDLQYAEFKLDGTDENGQSLKGHFANIGMQIGPSVTVTPINRLHAKAYVHYAPSAAVFLSMDSEDQFGHFGYAGYVTGGLQVSYRFVTLGVELRSVNTKLLTNSSGDDEDSGDFEESEESGDFRPKVTSRLPGTRIILGFRF